MIQFDKFRLDNGLRVLVHQDYTTPIVAYNVLYDVGSRDEDPAKTGFAHLFEHLMFGGSKNIPVYDEPLEKVGGENNAFTSNDITSYFITLPKSNLETAFWLESDRMLDLAFSRKSLNVQRKVVMEEFRQTHLNQPYGDAWLLLRPLAYRTHPYRWATIGADIQHIADARMADVRDFYGRFYHPANAILTIAGPVEAEEVKHLCNKWFADIPGGLPNLHKISPEGPQTEGRKKEVERNVPHDAIYKAWHIAARLDANYYIADLVSDILSGGDSSRLFIELVKKQQLFSDVNAYITGSIDPGLFVITGKLMEGATIQQGEAAIESELSKLRLQPVNERELQKVKNRIESITTFSEMKVLEKALNLSYYELLGDAGMINSEVEKYQQITPDQIVTFSKNTLTDTNCSTLYYHARKN